MIRAYPWRPGVQAGEALSPRASGDAPRFRSAVYEYWTEDTRNAVEDFVAGDGWWDGPRATPGFVVQQPGHWIFAGTGLAHGETLGGDTWPPLPGYECDGVPVDHIGPDGQAILSAWRDDAGTPDGYQLLAACRLDRRWQELPPRERHGAGEGIHVAAMGMFRHGGTVFCAGTTDWAQVRGDAPDRRVERITRNVLDRLCHA